MSNHTPNNGWVSVKDRLPDTDRDDFEDDVYTVLEGEERYDDLSDEEFDSVVKQKIAEYDAFWKPCIILYVDYVGH